MCIIFLFTNIRISAYICCIAYAYRLMEHKVVSNTQDLQQLVSLQRSCDSLLAEVSDYFHAQFNTEIDFIQTNPMAVILWLVCCVVLCCVSMLLWLVYYYGILHMYLIIVSYLFLSCIIYIYVYNIYV